ncbi:hypothetical protein GGS23DRAFT_580545 [Durotheca rogersii]|uniref:uncharacterized protein n=1 Tax=Durotheca rogersii TaxID=419775 RepID=UPI00221F7DC1|nr:uncharacterized protein GGS23DRAFT_580545 [Durotheca rogersii]KAI5860540.1 hypothetical protein GGS23DRAFT_580545 [Durotheca rogersii]
MHATQSPLTMTPELTYLIPATSLLLSLPLSSLSSLFVVSIDKNTPCPPTPFLARALVPVDRPWVAWPQKKMDCRRGRYLQPITCPSYTHVRMYVYVYMPTHSRYVLTM